MSEPQETETHAGALEKGQQYREFGDDDWRTITDIGWWGDAVLIKYTIPSDTGYETYEYETTLDADTMVARLVPA